MSGPPPGASPEAGGAVYRAMLRLYPRPFRDEYGADMALLLAEQLRDERPSRVWARTVLDLAISIPTRHLEAHMDHPPTPTVPLVFSAISVTGICVALVGGTSRGMLVVGLCIALAAALFAAASWRQTRTVAASGTISGHWWKFLGGGAGAIAAFAIITSAIEMDDWMWWAAMVYLFLATMLVVTGLMLGLVRFTNRPSGGVDGPAAIG